MLSDGVMKVEWIGQPGISVDSGIGTGSSWKLHHTSPLWCGVFNSFIGPVYGYGVISPFGSSVKKPPSSPSIYTIPQV
jgi:hypothetical protein